MGSSNIWEGQYVRTKLFSFQEFTTNIKGEKKSEIIS